VVTPLGSGGPTAASIGPVLGIALTVSAAIALGALLVARRRPPHSPRRASSEYTPPPPSDLRPSPGVAPGSPDEDPLRELW
jgi:hypothetical protein